MTPVRILLRVGARYWATGETDVVHAGQTWAGAGPLERIDLPDETWGADRAVRRRLPAGHRRHPAGLRRRRPRPRARGGALRLLDRRRGHVGRGRLPLLRRAWPVHLSRWGLELRGDEEEPRTPVGGVERMDGRRPDRRPIQAIWGWNAWRGIAAWASESGGRGDRGQSTHVAQLALSAS